MTLRPFQPAPSAAPPGRALLPRAALPALLAASLLAACGSAPQHDKSGLAVPQNRLLKEDRGANGGSTPLESNGVNAFLWRGALDTLSFMPFASADAVAGVILTDWYTPPATKDERFKITCFVLSRSLRSDAVRVSVFRQAYEEGQWVDTPVAANTVSDITARILTRARQLRTDSGQH
ncbi:hypothetical protein CFR75_04790 [Komagataeibacter xylinus]|uniref:Uncharacterized protein n=1 Tax=Komagataeibacter xylinus TaxID=28448 RepID=A0A318PQ51_KOMXY|nr:DUF3576 domain-containing protein [Komagataeibacter xylinus]AZV40345.1 DUF3576 domain-containing protein [Komagataeibacter xylinus]PYD57825.1 hypothetical protein CFR75_04790 [Komagataeibacter xylinus]